MIIQTVNDLKKAIIDIYENKISSEDIIFSEFITDSIKINSDKWGTISEINYKTAEYITSIQKDVLKAYNLIFDTSIKTKDLENFSFLIVSFTIEDGCVKYIYKISKIFIEKVMNDMSPNKKLFAIAIIALAIIAFPTSACIEELARIGIFDSDDIKKLRIFASQKSSANMIINNIGNGSVIYDDEEMTKKDLKDNIPHDKEPSALPTELDDEFIVLRYDYDKQQIYLSHPSCDSFWASTKYLTYEKLETLKKISNEAIEKGKPQTARLLISAVIDDEKVKNAVILGISLGEEWAKISLREAVKKSSQKDKGSKFQQASLLD